MLFRSKISGFCFVFPLLCRNPNLRVSLLRDWVLKAMRIGVSLFVLLKCCKVMKYQVGHLLDLACSACIRVRVLECKLVKGYLLLCFVSYRIMLIFQIEQFKFQF